MTYAFLNDEHRRKILGIKDQVMEDWNREMYTSQWRTGPITIVDWKFKWYVRLYYRMKFGIWNFFHAPKKRFYFPGHERQEGLCRWKPIKITKEPK